MSKISFQNRKLLNDHHPPISTQLGGVINVQTEMRFCSLTTTTTPSVHNGGGGSGGQCAKSLISEYETKSQIETVC